MIIFKPENNKAYDVFEKAYKEHMSNNVFLTEIGKEMRFNDHVFAECVLAPIEKRSGRLVQVRKGCGQFGSTVYIVRLRDGALQSFENVMLRRVDDEGFVNAFYRSNDREPPCIPHQEIDPRDNETEPYNIEGKFPETGFIIENPSQPETPGCFSMTITGPGQGVEVMG